MRVGLLASFLVAPVGAVFANAVLYAISQPDHVEVSDLAVRFGKEA